MTKTQISIGVVSMLALTAAVGVGVGNQQAKAKAADSIASLTSEAAELRRELQQTQADLAALVRTAKQPKIVPAARPAPAPSPPKPIPAEGLREKDAEIAALKKQLAAATTAQPQPTGRRGWQQRMEDLKRDNPEEYQRVQEERQQWRQEISQRTTDRYQFFAQLPTEGLSEDYLNNHQALMERMEFMNSAMAQIAADPESDASMQLRREMREKMRGTHEMIEMEKEVLVNDALSGLGISEQESAEVTEYLKYIDEMTSMGAMWGRGRR